VATKNSRQPFNSVRHINALCALPTILRYYLDLTHYSKILFRPALKIINLAKEARNSGTFDMLPQGTSQQLLYIGWPPRKEVKNLYGGSKRYRIELGAGKLAKEMYEK